MSDNFYNHKRLITCLNLMTTYPETDPQGTSYEEKDEEAFKDLIAGQLNRYRADNQFSREDITYFNRVYIPAGEHSPVNEDGVEVCPDGNCNIVEYQISCSMAEGSCTITDLERAVSMGALGTGTTVEETTAIAQRVSAALAVDTRVHECNENLQATDIRDRMPDGGGGRVRSAALIHLPPHSWSYLPGSDPTEMTGSLEVENARRKAAAATALASGVDNDDMPEFDNMKWDWGVDHCLASATDKCVLECNRRYIDPRLADPDHRARILRQLHPGQTPPNPDQTTPGKKCEWTEDNTCIVSNDTCRIAMYETSTVGEDASCPG